MTRPSVLSRISHIFSSNVEKSTAYWNIAWQLSIRVIQSLCLGRSVTYIIANKVLFHIVGGGRGLTYKSDHIRLVMYAIVYIETTYIIHQKISGTTRNQTRVSFSEIRHNHSATYLRFLVDAAADDVRRDRLGLRMLQVYGSKMSCVIVDTLAILNFITYTIAVLFN